MNPTARVVKIIRITYGPDRKFANVLVKLDDGLEATIFCGGVVETWYDPTHNKIKARVKRKAT